MNMMRADGRVEIIIEYTQDIDLRVLNKALMKFGQLTEIRNGSTYTYPDLGYGFGLLVPGSLSLAKINQYDIKNPYLVGLINPVKFDLFKDEVMRWNGIVKILRCEPAVN